METEDNDVEPGVAGPDFSLESNEGRQVRLSEFRGRSSVLLYFMREFTWSQCFSHAVQLGRLNDQIAASGTSTLVIGPRGQTAAALVARKLEAPFPVLADPARRAYRAYGFTKSLWVIQQSGWVLIDRAGIVQHVSRNTNPQNSFDEDEVLQAVKSLGS